ncbi:LuxR C-terminal-related transcriptional regulator [Paenibacillus sp. OAE614]|uniref:helix-turn-helix transcriptional regulator n=1 Tax=Paenibacillus sp. OAE614 TaxID=2663804 RepID=UPI001789B189
MNKFASLQAIKPLEKMLEPYHLSKREMEIFFYWIVDFDYKEISDILMISKATVRTHINNINLKIDSHSKASLILTLLLKLVSEINF